VRRLGTESRDLQELRGDVHDLTDTIGGLGIELEALNTSVRALTAHLIGEDPLADSLYFGDSEAGETSGPSEAQGDPQPPAWVNEALVGEQNGGRVAGYIVLAVLIGCLLAFALVLYAIWS
jgi:hypothetical protein